MKSGNVFLLSCGLAMLGAASQACASHGANPTFHAAHVNNAHSAHAWGHGHGHRGHFYFGTGFYGFWPVFYPGYFDGYGVQMTGDSFLVQQAAPVEYVEMAPPSMPDAQPAAANSWYYCRSPDGYYPYVKTCNGNWEVVPAQPPAK